RLEDVCLLGELVLRRTGDEKLLNPVAAIAGKLGGDLDLATDGGLVAFEGELTRGAHRVEILPLARQEAIDIKAGDLERGEVFGEVRGRRSRLGWAGHGDPFNVEGLCCIAANAAVLYAPTQGLSNISWLISVETQCNAHLCVAPCTYRLELFQVDKP